MFSTANIIFAALAATNAAVPYPPIYGGEYSSIETYPSQVGVESESGRCGGTIIAESWVLTAAHCIKPSAMQVRSGSSYVLQGGTIHPVAKKYVHGDYHASEIDGLRNFDIALLELSEPIKFDRIRKPAVMVRLDYQVRTGMWGIVSGWGDTEKKPYTGQLQSVAVPLISLKDCQRYYDAIKYNVPKDNFCGGYVGLGLRDSCQGDSGGPLMIDGRLAGVVSWGEGCVDKRFPGAYVNVGIHRKWIYSIAGV